SAAEGEKGLQVGGGTLRDGALLRGTQRDPESAEQVEDDGLLGGKQLIKLFGCAAGSMDPGGRCTDDIGVEPNRATGLPERTLYHLGRAQEPARPGRAGGIEPAGSAQRQLIGQGLSALALEQREARHLGQIAQHELGEAVLERLELRILAEVNPGKYR